jgi:cyclic pyranopterin phosphate synthase
VKHLLRSDSTDDEIRAVIRQNVSEKWIGHEINSTKFVPPPRPMYSIGG